MWILMHIAYLKLIFGRRPYLEIKLQSPVQKNNLVVFPCEYTYVYLNRYTWYICIAVMICTSLQDYLYPMIQRKSIPQTSLVIILTHTCTHTRNCKSL